MYSIPVNRIYYTGQIRLCVEAAGGTPGDIIKIEFWMKQPSTGRAALNEEWVKMFPDEHSRPSRHSFNNPDLPTGCLVQCEIMAYVD